jgi:hypothetical protein
MSYWTLGYSGDRSGLRTGSAPALVIAGRAPDNRNVGGRPVPPEGPSSWGDIQDLALSIDGYEAAGSFDACAQGAKGVSASYDREGAAALEAATIENLRVALFFEARSAHHQGDMLGDGWLRYLQAIASELTRRKGPAWIWRQVRQGRTG